MRSEKIPIRIKHRKPPKLKAKLKTDYWSRVPRAYFFRPGQTFLPQIDNRFQTPEPSSLAKKAPTRPQPKLRLIRGLLVLLLVAMIVWAGLILALGL